MLNAGPLRGAGKPAKRLVFEGLIRLSRGLARGGHIDLRVARRRFAGRLGARGNGGKKAQEKRRKNHLPGGRGAAIPRIIRAAGKYKPLAIKPYLAVLSETFPAEASALFVLARAGPMTSRTSKAAAAYGQLIIWRLFIGILYKIGLWPSLIPS